MPTDEIALALSVDPRQIDRAIANLHGTRIFAPARYRSEADEAKSGLNLGWAKSGLGGYTEFR